MEDVYLFCGVLGLLLSLVAVIATVVDRRQQRRDRQAVDES